MGRGFPSGFSLLSLLLAFYVVQVSIGHCIALATVACYSDEGTDGKTNKANALVRSSFRQTLKNKLMADSCLRISRSKTAVKSREIQIFESIHLQSTYYVSLCYLKKNNKPWNQQVIHTPTENLSRYQKNLCLFIIQFNKRNVPQLVIRNLENTAFFFCV